MNTRVVLGTLIVVVLLGATCGGSGDSPETVTSSDRNNRLELTAAAPSTVTTAAVTSAEVSITNIGDALVRVEGDCGADFGLVVIDEGGRVAFDLYDYLLETQFSGQVPECPPIDYPLNPGESLARLLPFTVESKGDYRVRVNALSETVGTRSVEIGLTVELKIEAR